MIYQTLENGMLKDENGRFIPEGHPLYAAAQQEVLEGVSTIVDYAPPPPDPREVRDAALRALSHDFGDGRVIQVRPPKYADDESNIRNAMERMARQGQPSLSWMMEDNTIHSVTASELQDALNSAQDQGAQVWADFFEEVTP